MVPSRRNQADWLPEMFNDFFDDRWMERPFDGLFGLQGNRTPHGSRGVHDTTPAVNVMENEKAYEIELATPGMTKDNFTVNLNKEGNLVIKMEKKREDENCKSCGHYLRHEFFYGKFQQTMLLPDDADREKICAKVENGILSVSIPKVERGKEANIDRSIKIN